MARMTDYSFMNNENQLHDFKTLRHKSCHYLKSFTKLLKGWKYASSVNSTWDKGTRSVFCIFEKRWANWSLLGRSGGSKYYMGVEWYPKRPSSLNMLTTEDLPTRVAALILLELTSRFPTTWTKIIFFCARVMFSGRPRISFLDRNEPFYTSSSCIFLNNL